jgi:hypothetical protein
VASLLILLRILCPSSLAASSGPALLCPVPSKNKALPSGSFFLCVPIRPLRVLVSPCEDPPTQRIFATVDRCPMALRHSSALGLGYTLSSAQLGSGARHIFFVFTAVNAPSLCRSRSVKQRGGQPCHAVRHHRRPAGTSLRVFSTRPSTPLDSSRDSRLATPVSRLYSSPRPTPLRSGPPSSSNLPSYLRSPSSRSFRPFVFPQRGNSIMQSIIIN